MHYKDGRGSICHAAMTISNDLSINTIVIMTESGVTAMKMAQHRPKARIFALCPNYKVCCKLALIWGVTPLLVNPTTSTDKMIIDSGELLKERKIIKKGDSFIITAGVSVGVTGSTNMLKIHKV
jgi:pyruvate kinase